ncbi:F-box protein [Quillaja saponaria]|uniref:F-box protein n=1 Tax=Quillaja saponaria TaxID=32244 RepID=A0AAD7M0J9_QUISA|nr:F-box protein [Quillaja saponaria]
MASLQSSTCLSSSCSSSSRINAAVHVPKLIPFSLPKIPTTRKLVIEELNGFTTPIIPIDKNDSTKKIFDESYNSSTTSKATIQLYAVLEAVADRIEMHDNIGQQRQNWNTLLLNSTNMITLTATTMAGIAAVTSGADDSLLVLKLSAAVLFSAATGLSLVMNKIQPSQLAEEQRNATRLFKQLQTQIKTAIALRNPTQVDVKDAMEKVLALDKAYPLPLLGAMLDKFPSKYEPAAWWPSTLFQKKMSDRKVMQYSKKTNGWSEELEMELREVIEVVKNKDFEDYERLGNLVLKINKILAISGPLLTGIAAMGSAFVGNGSWAAIVPVMAGALATAINAFEHGGQVGMVFEMYRYCGGFFQLIENDIEATLEENDLERRENGELFEMKVAVQLGRSLSQLRELATKSTSSRIEGFAIDEFASKLF